MSRVMGVIDYGQHDKPNPTGSLIIELQNKDRRIAELEKIELQWLTYRNEIGKVEDLEKEVTRLELFAQSVVRLAEYNLKLESHIRAIAEHHDKQINFVESSDDIDYQTMRRDFALSGLEKP